MKKPKIESDDRIAKKGRTIIFKKKSTPNAAKWVKWLEDNCLSSAGPFPNICGMRNLYWGKTSLIVKAGAYIYLITTKDDGRKMPWERRLDSSCKKIKIPPCNPIRSVV